MPSRVIWVLFAVYLIAALTFGTYEVARDPFWSGDAETIGRMLGNGIALFALAGVLPLIGWAFFRFQTGRATVPLLAWLVIGAGMAYLSDIGNRLDRQLKTGKFLSDGGLVGKEKEDFLRSMKIGCEQRQRSSPLTAKVGISDANIVAYCDCLAAGVSEATTIEELRYFVSSGKPPTSFSDKATMLGQFCGAEILKKKS